MAQASRLSIQVTSLGFMERLPLTGQTKSVWSLNFAGEFFYRSHLLPNVQLKPPLRFPSEKA